MLTATKNTLVEKFTQVRRQTEDLCKPLIAEDYIAQPMVDVSPPKWHLAHTTWFFENFILLPQLKKYRVFHTNYNFLFNSYYESVGERLLRSDRHFLSRPPVDEIYRYREYVDRHMTDLLTQKEDTPPTLHHLIELGLQHEQQHQELLLTDIKYILGVNPLLPAYTNPSLRDVQKQSKTGERYLEVPEGIYEIGYDGNDFCFDNEKGVHRVFLHAYRIADRLTTNEEYLEFIETGGYTDFKYWLSDGWSWLKENNIAAPLYWKKAGDEWYRFSLHGLQKLDPAAPVSHVSFYEADAFASWKKRRLPTEFEWETAVKQHCLLENDNSNFSDTGHYDPMAKDKNNLQFLGDAWEWTNSAYLPYPYYKQEEGALGEYNGKFMMNQMVLRGGSCATPRNHIRITYRNFFYPYQRWQFTGIRLADWA